MISDPGSTRGSSSRRVKASILPSPICERVATRLEGEHCEMWDAPPAPPDPPYRFNDPPARSQTAPSEEPHPFDIAAEIGGRITTDLRREEPHKRDRSVGTAKQLRRPLGRRGCGHRSRRGRCPVGAAVG